MPTLLMVLRERDKWSWCHFFCLLFVNIFCLSLFFLYHIICTKSTLVGWFRSNWLYISIIRYSIQPSFISPCHDAAVRQLGCECIRTRVNCKNVFQLWLYIYEYSSQVTTLPFFNLTAHAWAVHCILSTSTNCSFTYFLPHTTTITYSNLAVNPP